MPDRSLIVTLGVAVALVALSARGLYSGVESLPKDSVATGLTNLATIGGIVSGLSLSGTAVLSLSGKYVARLHARYGYAIRFVLFGGFALVVTLSLGCAVATMWSDEWWARVLVSVAAPTILAVLISTALLVNSAFAWKERGDTHVSTPAPY